MNIIIHTDHDLINVIDHDIIFIIIRAQPLYIKHNQIYSFSYKEDICLSFIDVMMYFKIAFPVHKTRQEMYTYIASDH